MKQLLPLRIQLVKALLSNIMDFKFIEFADINNDLKIKLSDLAVRDEVAFLRLARNYSDGSVKGLKKRSDLIRLAAALKASEFTYEKYQKKGIPDSVFIDTLADIGLWCRENNNIGLKNYQWIKHHVSFRLFKLGRLQFQIFQCKNPAFHYSRLPFNYGDYVINVHIPACGKLDIHECRKSFILAVDFFSRYFPEIKWDYFLCESWLVYNGNADFMDGNSNILNFSKLFDIHYSIHYENQTYDRLFGLKNVPFFRFQIKNLAEDTSLQRRAKAYRLAHNRFGIGIATIKKQAVRPPEFVYNNPDQLF